MTKIPEVKSLDPYERTAESRCVHLSLASPEDTEGLGAHLARHAPWSSHGGVLSAYLHGELGAGKTSLAQAVLRTLGVTGRIPSPSYTLVEPYDTPHGRVLHIDLYRLNAVDELEALGLRDQWLDCALLLIEWPEKAGPALPPCDIDIELAVAGQGRRVTLCGISDRGCEWLGGVCGNAVEGVPR